MKKVQPTISIRSAITSAPILITALSISTLMRHDMSKTFVNLDCPPFSQILNTRTSLIYDTSSKHVCVGKTTDIFNRAQTSI